MPEISTNNAYLEILERLKDLKDNGHDKPSPISLIDPTANVLALVKAEKERADDLRNLEMKYDERIQRIEERCSGIVADLKLRLQDAETKRIDAVKLAESARVDALLAASTTNVALAHEKSATQATTLAQQVATTAESLRVQVATTAQSTNAKIDSATDSLSKRISALEQTEYRSGGIETQRSEGHREGQWKIGIAIGLIVAVVEIVIRLMGK